MKLKLFSTLVLTVILSFTIKAHAGTTFTVDSPEDLVDINPGDCYCLASNQSCTLRAAVMEANACAGADTIILPADTYILSITGTGEDEGYTGDLDVTEDVTINGDRASTTIVDADGIDRIFHVFDGVVSFSGFTIQNGDVSYCDGNGGGILVEFYDSSSFSLDEMEISDNLGNEGGGVYISGTGSLSISDSDFENNLSVSSGALYIAFTTVEIEETSFTENTSGADGSAIYAYSSENLLISDTLFEDNLSVGPSGALHVNSSIVEIKGSIFTGNVCGSSGPAIYADGEGSEVTVYQSTISDNIGYLGFAGAIYNVEQSIWILHSTINDNDSGGIGNEGGTTWVFNSTISGNSSTYGAGLYSDDGTLYVSHSTITDNNASFGGGLYGGATFYLKNTILVGNTSYYESTNDCSTSATIVSNDYNWFDSDECSSMAASSNDVDEPYNSAYLENLADNGGPTETHALATASPAVKAGTCYDLDGDRVSFDQRGHLRLGKCDIGAYEIGPELKIPTFPLGVGMIVH